MDVPDYSYAEDRTFKGYELYSAEVAKRVKSSDDKIKKYKERETVCAAIFMAGVLMMALAIGLTIYGYK